jgi:hypothetical protein
MNTERVAWESVEWVYFAQVNGRWRALVVSGKKLEAGNSLSSPCMTVAYLLKTVTPQSSL